jgi:hypothetical protein
MNKMNSEIEWKNESNYQRMKDEWRSSQCKWIQNLNGWINELITWKNK